MGWFGGNLFIVEHLRRGGDRRRRLRPASPLRGAHRVRCDRRAAGRERNWRRREIADRDERGEPHLDVLHVWPPSAADRDKRWN